MPSRPPRVYIDANVLIAYVGNEENRVDTVHSILDDARDSKIKLLTSVLSITEVAYVATESRETLSSDDDIAIDQLWTPASPITLVDFSETVARVARSVIRKAKSKRIRSVGSADAIHLATAALQDCDRFYTYENEARRKGWNRLVRSDVSEPFTDRPRLAFESG